MDWETLSLSDIHRLVRAIEQAAGGKTEVIQGIIDRIPAEPLLNGHATIGTLRRLLEQLSGQLPEEVIALLRQQQKAPVINQVQEQQPPRPPTFDDLVVACHFTSVERGFTEEHFPLVDDGTVDIISRYSIENVSGVAAQEAIRITRREPVGVRRALVYIAIIGRRTIAENPIAIIGARWGDRIPVLLPSGKLALFNIKAVFPGTWDYLVTRS